VMLDHLTRGRMMFGVGPGQLTTDAEMLGIDPNLQRPRMEQAFDVIMRLFRGETVTEQTDWYTCHNAQLQMLPYSDFEICVAASVSPSGSKTAGKYGTGLISIAATNPMGVELLAGHWKIAEEQAARHGTTVSRDRWRLMGPMFIADTVAEAKKACQYGLGWVMDYLNHIIPTGNDGVVRTFDEMVDHMNATGSGVIGTPEMAIAQIERLQEKSGGFGSYLLMGADFANWSDTKRHYELFAEEVIPHFTGQLPTVQRAYDQVMNAGTTYVDRTLTAQFASIAAYQAENEPAAN
jgi:limonene 1,2-monooxygenase